MSLEQDLWGVVGSLVGGRVYSHRLPEDPAFPAIVFRMIDNDVLQDQLSYNRHPRYRFDVWTATYDDMVSVSATLRGTIDHNPTLHGLLDDEIDVPERAEQIVQEEALSGLYHRVLDFTVWGI